MTNYKVVKTNLLHDGAVYPVGSLIELNDEQAGKLQYYLERQNEPNSKTDQAQTDTTHNDCEEMTISELKKLVEQKNIEVIPSGTNGRAVKADYIKALEQ